MAKPTKKKTPKKKKSKAGRKRNILPWLFAFNLLLLFFLTLVGAGYFIFLHPWTTPPSTGKVEGARPAGGPITIEAGHRKRAVAGHPDKPGEASLKTAAPTSGKTKPRVAILIDDMGHDPEIGHAFLGLGMDLSFAFLPLAPHSRQLSLEASRLNRDILLHLPLEPENPKDNPGPGSLFVAMDHATMRATFFDDLARLPLAMGVNNHMGSKFTASRPAMEYLLELIRQRDLFFVDSVTTPASVGFDVARAKGLRTARRQVFLDHQQDKKDIIAQVDRLIDVARKKGYAIAIGHPHPVTMEVLRDLTPRLAATVTVVPIHELVEKP